MSCFDIVVIGGGVNGCGVARDGAGRGLTVLVCDKGDIGGATSSSSTKLVHGGLRYLEQLEFRLVKEALRERETLLRIAPHIVRPLRFVLPHDGKGRSWPLLRLGLLFYDTLATRSALPATRALDLSRDPAGAPLQPSFVRALEYSDCWVEDARLVVLNAVDAAERGAVVAPRTRCVSAERAGGLWRIVLEGPCGRQEISARALVNAAGPWVSEVLNGPLRSNAAPKVRLVRGSHIVTRRLFSHDRAYLLQQPDGRVVFAIPFERDFTLVGTTDVDHRTSADGPRISAEETAYLCGAASAAFRETVTPDMVVWSYSGVRPLYDDGAETAQQTTRDYVVEMEAGEGRPPLVTVYGGKITTYRKLAEVVLDKLADVMAVPRGRWTGRSPLPGGGFPRGDAGALAARLIQVFPHVGAELADRLVRAYGSRAWIVLEGTRSAADLGRIFGADLTEREVRYLVEHEWARTAEDVLWRRTKLGLRFSDEQRRALAEAMPGGEA